MHSGRKAAALSQCAAAAQGWVVMSKPQGGRWGLVTAPTHIPTERCSLSAAPSIQPILLHATKAQELGSALMQLSVWFDCNSRQLLLRGACTVHLQNNSIQGNRALISLENPCATVAKSASERDHSLKHSTFPYKFLCPAFMLPIQKATLTDGKSAH